MHIKINEDYNVVVNTALLGYVGETNARPVSVEGMEIDDADRYVLTIDYGDGVTYEVDITGGTWTPTADILQSAQTVSCQIAAKKLSGDEYILVKKSRIFRLRIGAAIGDNAVPSPDVSMDALDHIDAIGRQAHADSRIAVTAADTATTAANNATKSATAAEKSADTAEQAASRAETAQASAETSATQAETARQGAETARQQAATAQNAAKISADQAASAAKQTTADKTATAGYAQTAKTSADSTTADRQAVADMAAQVTADKATVTENTAKVATDRKAAENAAQTAKAVADSLPDDYTTAVAKIAENTAEISAVKLTDKELQRRVNALYSIGQGITHQFETDTDTAYVKTIPTGGKLMSVKSVGGRSIVWNQLVDSNIVISETTRYSFNGQHLTTNITDGLSLSDDLCTLPTIPVGHKVLIKVKFIAGNVGNKEVNIGGYHKTTNKSWQCKIDLPKNIELAGKTLIAMDTTTDTAESIRFFLYNATIPLLTNIDCYINYYDLTAMFGAGNEPSTVEEFEKMFPNDYYPYNAGEIISAGVTEVVEQGRNLWDEVWGVGSINASSGNDEGSKDVIYSKNYTPIIPNSTYIFVYTGSASFENVKTRFYDHSKNYIGYNDNNGQTVYPNRAFITPLNAAYVRFTLPTEYGNVYKNDIALIAGSSGDYTPYHRNEYPIPEAIKALPGYGWSAGTARNYVDYENKRYVQCVNSVDLGTLTWTKGESVSFKTHHLAGQKLTNSYSIAPNFICPKYSTKTQNESWGKTSITGISATLNVGGYIYVNDTSYADAATFKQAMQGVMLYYELATPIVTDISALLTDDFLRNLTVEAGGSITFKGSNDSYHIPVPSELEYIVKLSEVGGSV